MQCECGRCDFQIVPYVSVAKKDSFFVHTPRKAGALLYDPDTQRVCLVQSRGNLWGCPKGSLDNDETFVMGAIREVKEETGITLVPEQLSNPIWVNSNVVYYLVPTPLSIGGSLQDLPGNDANGFVWIKLTCLTGLIRSDDMRVTSHTRKALLLGLGVELSPKPG